MAYITEESTIDHIIMSTELASNVTNILVDEEQKYALTRITKTKHGVVVKRSDPMQCYTNRTSTVMDLNIKKRKD